MDNRKWKRFFVIVAAWFSSCLVTGCIRIYPYRICGNVVGEIDSIRVGQAHGKQKITQNGSKYCATGHVVIGMYGVDKAVCKGGMEIPMNILLQRDEKGLIIGYELNGRPVKRSRWGGVSVDSLDLNCLLKEM